MKYPLIEGNSNGIQQENPPAAIEIIFHANLLLRVLIGCESENFEAIESILTLIYAKEITAYIEDTQLATVKEYYSRFTGEHAEMLIAALENDFKTYSVTSEDIKRVSELTVENLQAGIAIACAERKNIDIVVTELAQAVNEEFSVFAVNPQEFILRYDSINRCFKNNVDIPRASIVNDTSDRQIDNLDSFEPIQSIIDIKFGDWNIESFETSIQFKDETRGSVRLWNTEGQYIAKNAIGNGPVDALVKALNLALIEAKLETEIPPIIVDHVYLQSEAKGADSLVRANVSLVVPESRSIRGEFRHTDTVKAVFCACVKATADYVNQDKSKASMTNLTVDQIELDISDGKSLAYNDAYLQKLKSLPRTLSGLSFKRASIVYSNFSDVFIADYNIAAKWEKASIYYCDLISTRLLNICWQELEIHNSRLDKANFSCAAFDRITVRSSSFSNAWFDKAKFYNCTFTNSDFSAANFIYGEFHFVVFNSNKFNKANFSETQLCGISLTDADLSDAVFDGSKIERSMFISANLSNANFAKVKFYDVSFAMANLEGANFSDCDLRQVNFNGARLSKADLSNSIINASQLENAVYDDLDTERVNIIYGSDDSDVDNDNCRLHKCC